MSRRLHSPHHQSRVIPESISYHQAYHHNDLNCCYSDDADSSFLSDAATSYHHSHHQPHQNKQCCQHVTDRSYSDNSSRHDDYLDETSVRRSNRSRNSSSGRHHPIINVGTTPALVPVHGTGGAAVAGDVRRVYPKQQQQFYHEIPVGETNGMAPRLASMRRPPQPSAVQSSRPQSSMSSSLTTSAIVDGCGGKCQTFENVCYFFLQLVFIMGILIGVSLCIAGLVLRKSAARNLQVLVYIGALLICVCALLLGIQLNARNAAKRRKMRSGMAKRAPIPLERIQARQSTIGAPLVVLHNGNRSSQQIVRADQQQQPTADQPGIPWWREARAQPNNLF